MRSTYQKFFPVVIFLFLARVFLFASPATCWICPYIGLTSMFSCGTLLYPLSISCLFLGTLSLLITYVCDILYLWGEHILSIKCHLDCWLPVLNLMLQYYYYVTQDVLLEMSLGEQTCSRPKRVHVTWIISFRRVEV